MQPKAKPASTRHWGSVRDHADYIAAMTSGSGEFTPLPDDRREGFDWDVPREEGSEGDQHPRRPSALEPKGTARGLRHDSGQGKSESADRSDMTEPIPGMKRGSSSSLDIGLSREDTTRSSISTIVRGMRRPIPDVNMFDPGRTEDQHSRKEESQKPISKAGRRLSLVLPSALRKASSYEKSPKHTQFTDKQGKSPPGSGSPPGGLKERRNLNKHEALKLTLPLGLPALPPRQRPISEFINLRDIAPPRSRSPKTPWIRDTAPDWTTAPGPASAPPMIPEDSPVVDGSKHSNDLLPDDDTIRSSVSRHGRIRDRFYITKPRHHRNGSGTSESSLAITTNGATSSTDWSPVQPPEELRQLGELRKKRSKRWRWSGPRTSSDLDSPTSLASDISDSRWSFNRLLHLKKHPQAPHLTMSTASPPAATDKSAGKQHKTQTSKGPGKDILAKMPLPPTFIPPGVQRVPTPPIQDQNGEVKDKLAGFYFDVQGERRSKRPPITPGSIWDSDVLLMSQESNITSSSSSGNEAPPSSGYARATLHVPSLIDYPMSSPTGYTSSPTTTHSPHPKSAPPLSPLSKDPPQDHPDWFRVQLDEDLTPDLTLERDLGAEERAKYEWLIPEHLPNSPLCPLHNKYRGPNIGICVFHGRRKSSGDAS